MVSFLEDISTTLTGDRLLAGLSLIVFTDELGPKLVWSTVSGLMASETVGFRFNIAHRLVLVCGIGDTIVELEKLHGPVEIPEMEPTQVVWIFPIMVRDNQTIDTRIMRKGRLVIFVIHSQATHQKRLKNLEYAMETGFRNLVEILRDDKADQFTMDKIRAEHEILKLLTSFQEDLTRLLNLRMERERIGKNLFNLGTIRNLPGELQSLAKLLIRYPDGVVVSRIKSESEIDEDALDELIEQMELMGYIIVAPEGDDHRISIVQADSN